MVTMGDEGAVVTMGDEGDEGVVTRGDEGVRTHLTFGYQTFCLKNTLA